MRLVALQTLCVLALSSLTQITRADEPPPGPSCKCDVGVSTSGRSTAAACTVFGLSMLVFGRKRRHKQ